MEDRTDRTLSVQNKFIQNGLIDIKMKVKLHILLLWCIGQIFMIFRKYLGPILNFVVEQL